MRTVLEASLVSKGERRPALESAFGLEYKDVGMVSAEVEDPARYSPARLLGAPNPKRAEPNFPFLISKRGERCCSKQIDVARVFLWNGYILAIRNNETQ